MKKNVLNLDFSNYIWASTKGIVVDGKNANTVKHTILLQYTWIQVIFTCTKGNVASYYFSELTMDISMPIPIYSQCHMVNKYCNIT